MGCAVADNWPILISEKPNNAQARIHRRSISAIAEAGSITGAARRLALSKSVVSERLTELERGVGTKLVRRTTRSLSLTDDGKIFYERAKQIMQYVEDAASELAERRGTLSGPLRSLLP